jgi:predicted signal transduction protein with EAL and GGDEF domain
LGGIDGFEPDHLVRKADIALYKAKAAGRGSFRLFEQGMDMRIVSWKNIPGQRL